MGKRVITYGTFDLFHEGHRRLLERAKQLGDHLTVGVTTDAYDESRGKLGVVQSLAQRIENVRLSGLADAIVVEEYEGQKVQDIQKYDIDLFVIGSDWLGQFDYLTEYCEVTYLERTRGVSSTQLRDLNGGVIRLGIVGAGRIAERMVAEARFVSGIAVQSVCSRTVTRAKAFAEKFEIADAYTTFDDMLSNSDAVYIATPHGTHHALASKALDAGVHVLCEKPLALTYTDAADLFARAEASNTVLLEAIKTAFAPGFQRMLAVAHSGAIGTLRSVDATFTKLVTEGREYDAPDGGSITELASYPMLAAAKLLGPTPLAQSTMSLIPDGCDVDVFSRTNLTYPHAIASITTGIGVKAEGDLVVAGSLGYLYVPAPWWLTEYFETRFEDSSNNRKYYYKFDGDGLRYELAEFVRMIRSGARTTFKLRPAESIAIAKMIEQARSDSATILT